MVVPAYMKRRLSSEGGQSKKNNVRGSFIQRSTASEFAILLNAMPLNKRFTCLRLVLMCRKRSVECLETDFTLWYFVFISPRSIINV